MIWVAVILGATALLLSLYNFLRVSRLQNDLRYAHRSARTNAIQADKAIEELRAEVAKLKASAKPASSAGSWFSPRMTIQDALKLHPGVKEVLAKMHIGGCSSCSVSATETLAEAAEGHGVDLEEMLSGLNSLMSDEKPAPKKDMLPPAEGGRIMLGAVGQPNQ